MTNYSFLTVDVPGAASTSAMGINDRGQVVGSYMDPAGRTHGFVETGGHFTTIDVPGAGNTEITAINNLGQFVGDFTDASGSHGFLDSFGHISTIDMPGADGTYLGGINDLGQIVGGADMPGGSIREVAFLDSGGSFSTLHVPGYQNTAAAPPIGGTYMWASGINDGGQITVDVHNAPGSFSGAAYIDSNGTFSKIAPPDANGPPSVGGINDSGVTAGGYAITPPAGTLAVPQVGYADSNGTFTPLAPFGSNAAQAAGIDDLGRVVGNYTDSLGHTHGFLATPESPPLTVASVLGGVLPGFLRG